MSKRLGLWAPEDVRNYFKSKSSFDSVFAVSFLDDSIRCDLDRLKEESKGQKICSQDGLFGFVPKGSDFNPFMDIERLIVQRHAAKSSRDFSESDSLRKKIESFGYEINDTKDGTDWFYARSLWPERLKHKEQAP